MFVTPASQLVERESHTQEFGDAALVGAPLRAGFVLRASCCLGILFYFQDPPRQLDETLDPRT